MRTAAATTWADICDELVEIEHQLWRAALPVNYQPLQRDLATFHSLPLELNAAGLADGLGAGQAAPGKPPAESMKK